MPNGNGIKIVAASQMRTAPDRWRPHFGDYVWGLQQGVTLSNE